MTVYDAKEYDRENKKPLNQAAKKALVELGEKPDPNGTLYAMQLARLELRLRQDADPMYSDMIEVWDSLAYRNPPRALMKLLHKVFDGDGEEEVIYPLDYEDPRDLSSLILEQLEEWVRRF